METENKIETYEEIFDGLSKMELFKGCRNHALYETLINDKASYRELKKYYKNRIKLEYGISSNTIDKLPGIFEREWKREKRLLDEDCRMIMKWAALSEDQVREKVRKYKENMSDLLIERPALVLNNINLEIKNATLDNDILLYGSNVPNVIGQVLCNMYPCVLTMKNMKFRSVEQAFYYLCFKENLDVQDKILTLKKPGEVTRYCANLKKDSDFEEKKLWVLESCLFKKYEQCEEFREILKNSGDLRLVETDDWGDNQFVGYKFLDGNKGMLSGNDYSGFVMMNVRQSGEEMMFWKNIFAQRNYKAIRI
jgi:predicted NAD-dependent protein-ADP-ribosyltransferase YbiA (DUF1768 family)